MKWLIDIEGVNLDSTVGLKLLFLQLFGLTVMHNNHKGSHLSIGFSFLIAAVEMHYGPRPRLFPTTLSST